jgi:PAS domain S-box-containing protein
MLVIVLIVVAATWQHLPHTLSVGRGLAIIPAHPQVFHRLLGMALNFGLSQRLAAIVESCDDAIIGNTIEGMVTVWNSGAERVFGYTAQEMIGQPISRLACIGREDDMVRVLDQIRGGERVDNYETMRRCKDGREIPVSLTVSRIGDSSGEIAGASGIARDISGRTKAEKEMRIAEKVAAMRRLASSIAHDINNPLAAIINLHFLLEGENLSEAGKRYLATAERELSRVAHITAQALGFYRTSGKPVWLSMATILDEAVAIHHDRFEALGIQLRREYAASPQICCHAGELRQVMVNIVGNALDAMPFGGRLRLKIRETTAWATDGRGVRVTVADTGHGMSAETRRSLFEPFYTTKEASGTGLGLWLCTNIVGKYEGRISMRSNDAPEHRGSVFMVFLPV